MEPKKTGMKKDIIWGVFTLAIGLVVFCFALFEQNSLDFPGVFARVQEVVYSVEEDPATETLEDVYTATVTYEVDGESYTASVKVDEKTKEGDRLEGRYNPENPAEFHTGDQKSVIWLFGTSAVSFALSVYFFAQAFRAKRKAEQEIQ